MNSTATQAPATESAVPAMSRLQSARRAAVVLLLSLGALLGLSLTTASTASADTVVRHATVCVNTTSSLRSHAVVTAYWFNGSQWVAQSTVSAASGCGTLALSHNGYYYLQAYTYAQVPCRIYRYFDWTNSFIKQNQAASFRVNLTPSYYDYINTYC